MPDLSLFPDRYTGVETVTFRAGLELAVLHFGLWAASWLVRAKIVGSLEPLAQPMKWLADLFQPLGSDRGGMFVDVTGIDRNGRKVKRTWTLIADSGHGPWIPVLPALMLTRRLRDRTISGPSAFPCMGFFDLNDFEKETAKFDIRTETREENA